MKVIGLTGGIGTGKSTVSEYLKKKGIYVIDADQKSRDAAPKGSQTLKALVETYGEAILLEDGNLDRKALARIVFNDRQKLARLEEIITDKVVREIFDEVNILRESGQYDIIVVDAPILIETGLDECVDSIWLVDADLEARIARVMERDGSSRAEIMSRINNQMSSEEKKKKSNEIIDNSYGKEVLFARVDELLNKYGR